MDKATLVHSGMTVEATSQGSTVTVTDPFAGGVAVSARPGSGRDYEALYNKPSIEGVELIGDKALDDFGMGTVSNVQILDLFR